MEISTRKCFAMTLALLAGALAACGTTQTSLNFDSYAHRVSDEVVALYWNCSRPAPGMVRLEGMANNPFYAQPIQDLEFRLYGVNAQGSDVSRAWGRSQAFLIYMNSPSPFTIDLRTQGSEVRYDMVYSYRLQQPPGGTRALVAGGEQQNYARDVCAELGP